MPELIIAEDARSHIEDVSFDVDAYSKYLRVDRHMCDDDIANISIILTNEGVSTMAIANTSPGFMNNGNHIIRISPTRFPQDIRKQGRILRHETEHVIQGCSWQYKAWALGQLSFVGAASIGGGSLFAQQTYEASEAIPEPGRIALSSIVAAGGLAVSAFMSSRIGKSLSPLEIGATIAERRYASKLADGTLVVNG